MQTVRGRVADRVNERYYARDNNPSYFQFGQRYHFYDGEQRLYMIQEKEEGRLFYNERFKPTHQRRERLAPKRCVVDDDGYVRLFVKLKNRQVRWFSDDDIGKVLTVRLRRGGDPNQQIQMRLRKFYKAGRNRCTGTIAVSMDRQLCNTLLNE